MTPFVDFRINLDRRRAPWMLRDDDFRTSLVQFCNDRVGIKGLVRYQSVEFDVLDQRRNPDRIEALTVQQNEAPRLPTASVRARISVVIPPFDLPMA